MHCFNFKFFIFQVFLFYCFIAVLTYGLTHLNLKWSTTVCLLSSTQPPLTLSLSAPQGVKLFTQIWRFVGACVLAQRSCMWNINQMFHPNINLQTRTSGTSEYLSQKKICTVVFMFISSMYHQLSFHCDQSGRFRMQCEMFHNHFSCYTMLSSFWSI